MRILKKMEITTIELPIPADIFFQVFAMEELKASVSLLGYIQVAACVTSLLV